MQDDEAEAFQAFLDLMARKEAALEGLNTRIARLAIALGLDLTTDVGLRQAMEPGRVFEPRQRPFLEELRGLLTLRYLMEKQLVDELGSQSLHEIVTDVERHMERIGFRHGMDGMHEDELFGESADALRKTGIRILRLI